MALIRVCSPFGGAGRRSRTEGAGCSSLALVESLSGSPLRFPILRIGNHLPHFVGEDTSNRKRRTKPRPTARQGERPPAGDQLPKSAAFQSGFRRLVERCSMSQPDRGNRNPPALERFDVGPGNITIDPQSGCEVVNEPAG